MPKGYSHFRRDVLQSFKQDISKTLGFFHALTPPRGRPHSILDRARSQVTGRTTCRGAAASQAKDSRKACGGSWKRWTVTSCHLMGALVYLGISWYPPTNGSWWRTSHGHPMDMMWVKPCHKHPMDGNGQHSTYKAMVMTAGDG